MRHDMTQTHMRINRCHHFYAQNFGLFCAGSKRVYDTFFEFPWVLEMAHAALSNAYCVEIFGRAVLLPVALDGRSKNYQLSV